jgi:hypothetical protein
MSKKILGEDEMLRTRRIRIQPTETQKKLFHRWFGITRFAYNEALRLIEEDRRKPCFIPLKGYLLKQENDSENRYPFLFDHDLCPSDAKLEAIRELCSAIAATKKSLKTKGVNSNHF